MVEPDGYNVNTPVAPDEVLAEIEESFVYEGSFVADFQPDLFLSFNAYSPPFTGRVTKAEVSDENPRSVTVYFKRIV